MSGDGPSPILFILLAGICACLMCSSASVYSATATGSPPPSSKTPGTPGTQTGSTAPSPVVKQKKSRTDFLNGLIKSNQIDRCIAHDGTRFYWGTCVPTDSQQLWTYNNMTLQHNASKQCLEGVGSGALFYLRNCNSANPFQRWQYNEPNFVHEAHGRCLQTDGEKLLFAECNANDPTMAWETSGTIV